MKNRIPVNACLFLMTLMALFLLNSLQTERPIYSEIENRALKTKPVFTWERLFSGAYFVEFENYFADTFVYREPLSKMSRSIQQWSGWRGEDQVQLIVHHGGNFGDALAPAVQPGIPHPEEAVQRGHADAKLYPPETSGAERIEGLSGEQLEAQHEHASMEPPEEENEAVSEEDDNAQEDVPPEAEDSSSDNPCDNADHEPDVQQVVGRILLMRDRAMNLYTFDAAAGDAYAALVNQFAKKAAVETKHDVTVYSLLAPTQIEFIAQSKYKELSDSQSETLAYVHERLDDAVIAVDAYGTLQDHAKEYLYFRTDHHWTARGAYYAYQAFMEASDQTPIALDQYEVTHVEHFLGSTYAAVLSKSLERQPDTIELFQPFIPHEYEVYYEGPLKMDVLDMSHAEKTNKYRIFLSGDRPWGKITTEAKTEKKIAVIKDSYANAFVPFLIPHYREIYIIDPRQYEHDIFELIDENQIEEVLFMTNMGVTSHQGFTNLLKDMIER